MMQTFELTLDFLIVILILVHLLYFQFPIGIDSDRFKRALELPQVKEHIKELKERFSGRKVYEVYYILLRIYA